MPKRPSTNDHGVDCAYNHSKLSQIKRDLSFYRPDELARALARLAYTADKQIAISTIEQLQLGDLNCGK